MGPKVLESESVVNSEATTRTIEPPSEPNPAVRDLTGQASQAQPTSQRPPEQERPKRPAPWQRPGFRKLMFAGAVVLVIAGVVLFLYYHNRESTDDAEVDAHLAPIS